MSDFVMPKNKRGKVHAPTPAPVAAPEPECPAPVDTTAPVEGEPQADAPASVETTAPVEPTTPIDHFAEWLKTPAGQDASDPRFLPEQAVRRQRELERRLKLAWDGATAS